VSAARVSQAEDIDPHELAVVFKRLVLRKHLHMLRIQFELRHRVHCVDLVFLHRELV
jgi:hypothetical protein